MRPPAEHIGVALNGGKGRAQLVGCVRNEGANLVLGAFAHFKGGIYVIEQLVEGVAHRTHFGTRVGVSRFHAHRRGDALPGDGRLPR